jgi:hypothetical protein
MKVMIRIFPALLLAMGLCPAGAGPPGWSVTPGQYDHDGSVTAAVYRGIIQDGSAGDMFGAFVGEECRGVVDAWETPIETYIFPITVYSNQASGESLAFRYYDSDADVVCDISERVEFIPDMTLGSLFNPLEMHIANCQPFPPSSPSPPDGVSGVPLDSDLAWAGGDPDDGDSVTYYVYFGTDADPPAYDTTETYPASTTSIGCELPALTEGTVYHWKVIAEDRNGSLSTGPLWTFTAWAEAIDPTTWSRIKALYR